MPKTPSVSKAPTIRRNLNSGSLWRVRAQNLFGDEEACDEEAWLLLARNDSTRHLTADGRFAKMCPHHAARFFALCDAEDTPPDQGFPPRATVQDR